MATENGPNRPYSRMFSPKADDTAPGDQPNSVCNGTSIKPGTARMEEVESSTIKVTAATTQA